MTDRCRLENVTIDFRLCYICLTCKIVAVVKEILFSRFKQRPNTHIHNTHNMSVIKKYFKQAIEKKDVMITMDVAGG